MKKFILLAILLICTNFHVYAKTSTEEHITGFIKELSSNNIKGTASRFFTESPHFIFGPRILTPKDSEQVEKVLSEIHDALAKKGYMNSEILNFEHIFRVGTCQLLRYYLNATPQKDCFWVTSAALIHWQTLQKAGKSYHGFPQNLKIIHDALLVKANT
ncbi:hypothetical protein ACJJID_11175 [Microbulbifer sp. CnH-101-G]|uniref:hypothetical protein n=1 Tax=Microbulbifer sp. CnH-101-G TaxID=3243393 RepID=UPI00403A0E64